MGGFDTHDSQNQTHADLMARVAHALRYFDTTLGAIGARNNVTTFTASDFGRTFTSNGDGTDHGWGAHHFVMGGAVHGGDLYGTFPTLGAKNAGNNDFDQPRSAGQRRAAAHDLGRPARRHAGRWFGLSDTQVLEIFPNLANFDAASATWASWRASDPERRYCNAFGHVRPRSFAAREIGDRARDAQDPVIGTRRQREAAHRPVEQRQGRRFRPDRVRHIHRFEPGVRPALPFELSRAGGRDPRCDSGRRLRGPW